MFGCKKVIILRQNMNKYFFKVYMFKRTSFNEEGLRENVDRM